MTAKSSQAATPLHASARWPPNLSLNSPLRPLSVISCTSHSTSSQLLVLSCSSCSKASAEVQHPTVATSSSRACLSNVAKNGLRSAKVHTRASEPSLHFSRWCPSQEFFLPSRIPLVLPCGLLNWRRPAMTVRALSSDSRPRRRHRLHDRRWIMRMRMRIVISWIQAVVEELGIHLATRWLGQNMSPRDLLGLMPKLAL